MMRIIYQSVLAIHIALFAANAMANSRSGVDQTPAHEFANYHDLVAKSEQRGKVRVIAKIKDFVTLQPGPNIRSEKLVEVREKLKQKGLRPEKELHRIGYLVYELNKAELDRLIESGLIERRL